MILQLIFMYSKYLITASCILYNISITDNVWYSCEDEHVDGNNTDNVEIDHVAPNNDAIDYPMTIMNRIV